MWWFGLFGCGQYIWSWTVALKDRKRQLHIELGYLQQVSSTSGFKKRDSEKLSFSEVQGLGFTTHSVKDCWVNSAVIQWSFSVLNCKEFGDLVLLSAVHIIIKRLRVSEEISAL